MTILYQYDSLVEPISQDAETVQIDKFAPILPEPKRASVFMSALFVASTFFVPVVEAVETVTLDKWFQPTSVPVVITPDINRGHYDIDSNALTLPESISLDKWYQELSRPVFTRPDIDRSQISFEPVIEIITLDKWFVETSRPIVLRQDINRGVITLETLPELITIDKWYQQPLVPIVTPRVPIQEGFELIEVISVAEAITLDKWFKELSVPVRLIETPVNTEYSYLIQNLEGALFVQGKRKVFTLDTQVRIFKRVRA